MALAITIIEHGYSNNKRTVRGTIAFDSSYPTGGEPLAARDIGLLVVDDIRFQDNGFRLLYDYDYTNSKVRVFYPTGGAAPAALGAPSVAVPSGATAVTSSAAQPDLTETGGQGVEVANGTNLSTVTGIRFRAEGV